MRKCLSIVGFSFFIFLVSSQLSSCKTAEGCQMEDKYQAKTDKHGNLSTKRGKSNLFSKKDRKKMRSGR